MVQLTGIIGFAFNIYYYMIIIYILMSWLPQLRETSFGEMLGRLVEPYLQIFRRFIPPLGMIDISPIVALFALHFAQRGLLSILYSLV
ncbi:YggT family protein [Aneurinibacillus aneurinilyticus]|jgi:YggT family protein|uniref:YggT family protein n=2 Tax=Aneurinibacillus aneurinilyticus TaxID=1391 RepID=A0A848CT44_ANEAE|nr:YggT family protein [Aneurinibacillus aneurinilyticus]ERI06915.1 YGGT family protein [Aneurinibacillus aneurinilyticus ATCC 12856]MCI1692301.1 YggT family protein [Aneurinibacillus aneurinilyticus]MED0669227.1 YggT family protein [Aneurinibacillus aneurinilyticus]MED0707941.1 YggT family protein [Aneurinibacillus aneurinilyticus]MED0722354.1 YggT family protein [Aneurinibacillus aneurinilyticus]